MRNDDKVIAKIPQDEKQAIVELGAKLDMTMGQIVRESLQRFKPVLIERVAERERATTIAPEVETALA
jgi:hypothetical protein